MKTIRYQPGPRALLLMTFFCLMSPRSKQLVESFSLPSSSPPPQPPLPSGDGDISRRNLLYWPVGVGGALVYGKLVSDAVDRLSRGDLVYPQIHERELSKVITQSLDAFCHFQQPPSTLLRILEVGIGKDCRVLRRGLYNEALERVASLGVSKVDILGIDLISNLPNEKTLQQTREDLERMVSQYGIQAVLNVRPQSITQAFEVADHNDVAGGSFDVVLCFLTLCSVDDPVTGIRQIRQLVRPDGGVFGYVEHVAVGDPGTKEPKYQFLEWQQRVLDPLQQALADNCHLHRSTDQAVVDIFEVGPASVATRVISQRNFLVDDMWPVSYQASGVIQRMVR
jgi:SAM-dependent methyltransferase